MSLEQLLLFVLLIGIPLLERLIRAIRARRSGSPAERTSTTPPEQTASRPRAPVPARHSGSTRPEKLGTERPRPASELPRTARPTASSPRSVGPGRARREPQRGPAHRVGALYSQRPKQGAAIRRFIAGGELQRAIVLVAILGPCRALEPKEASR